MMTTALVSIAAQHAPTDPATQAGGVRFYLLDGSPVDSRRTPAGSDSSPTSSPTPSRTSPGASWPASWPSWPPRSSVARRAKPASRAPSTSSSTTSSGSATCASRTTTSASRATARRRQTPPSKHFATILRDGPPVGVHTIVWCDSLNNLNRTFDRQTLREFEIRVLFQMSANDSSTLIDIPAAEQARARTGPSSSARRKAGWRSSAPTASRPTSGWAGSATSSPSGWCRSARIRTRRMPLRPPRPRGHRAPDLTLLDQKVGCMPTSSWACHPTPIFCFCRL